MKDSWNPILESGPYKNGFFTQVPGYTPGNCIILENTATGEAVLADGRIPASVIRKGKYDRMIRMDTRDRALKLQFSVPAAEENYRYEIDMRVRVKMVDPLAAYKSAVADIAQEIEDALFPTVKTVAGDYGILKPSRDMDEEMVRTCAARHGEDIEGISYEVSALVSSPDKDGMAYRKRYHDAELEKNAKIQEMNAKHTIEQTKLMHAKELSTSVDAVSSILAQVVEGTMSVQQAQENIHATQQHQIAEGLGNISDLVDVMTKMKNANLWSDDEIKALVRGRMDASFDIKGIEASGGGRNVPDDGDFEEDDQAI